MIMANHVTNRFTLIGNKSINKLTTEILRRFMADRKKYKDESQEAGVGRVLYGLSGEEAELTMSTTGAQWVYVEGPWEERPPLRMISAWNPVSGIQDHILIHAAKLDPNVIVINEYSDESASFIGCRIVQLKNGEILEYIEHEDTSELTIVDNEDDDEDYGEDDGENDDDSGSDEQEVREPGTLTWDELWFKLDDLKFKLVDGIVNDNPSHTKEKLLKLMDPDD
jgi:hypothetical protein